MPTPLDRTRRDAYGVFSESIRRGRVQNKRAISSGLLAVMERSQANDSKYVRV
jgi:hypothetical protein